jgi:hypothetical protein
MRLCDLIDSGFDIGMATAIDYPIFDEAYRAVLNQRITDHYALYEIGHETPSMFHRTQLTTTLTTRHRVPGL